MALGLLFDVQVKQRQSKSHAAAAAKGAARLATKFVLMLGHYAGEEWSHEQLRAAMRQAGVRYTSLAAQCAGDEG